jgi:hypothetical protein
VSASVITHDLPTVEQFVASQARAQQGFKADSKPLVAAARAGDLPRVQTICRNVPGKGDGPWTYHAVIAALTAGHNNVAEYLLYQQPGCFRKRGTPMHYYCFWQSIEDGCRILFDFFMARKIDVHYISTIQWSLGGTQPGQYSYRHVYVNAMSFLRAGYYFFGNSPGRQYIEEVLTAQGVTTAPGFDYRPPGSGDCCNVF